MDKSPGNKFLQCCLGKSVDIHGIPACKKPKGFDLLGRAPRIDAEKTFHIVFFLHYRFLSAGRAGMRNRCITASGQIFRNLRNDHICFVYTNGISDPQLQFLHDTDVMHTGPAHCGSFQFHRLKNCYRIDQSGPGRAPLNLQKSRITHLIGPFKCHGVPWKLGRSSQRFSVSNIIIQCHKPICRKIIGRNCFRKVIHRFIQSFCCDFSIFHNLKALFIQPPELHLPGITEIHSFRTH